MVKPIPKPFQQEGVPKSARKSANTSAAAILDYPGNKNFERQPKFSAETSFSQLKRNSEIGVGGRSLYRSSRQNTLMGSRDYTQGGDPVPRLGPF